MKENFAAKNEFYKPKIKIIGVGGCGQNIVNSLQQEELQNIEIFALNSDKNFLETAKVDEQHRIQIGERLTDGLGTGGNQNVGEKAAEESIEKIREIVKDTDILFVINGVAGGTAGAVPVITKLAKEQGAVNIVFAVTPFHFEGNRKNNFSNEALKKFTDKESCIDAVINVANERFLEFIDRKSTLKDGFNLPNEEASKCIKAFVDIFQEENGLIQISFKDFKEFMSNVGFTGIATSKYSLEKYTSKEVMNQPLIRGSFESAEKVLIGIKGGNNLTLHFVHKIAKEIQKSIDEHAEVMMSVQINNDLKANEFKLTVITA